MKYIGIAILIGIVLGVIHNMILFRHVLPYMKKRGVEVKGILGPFQFNRAVADYFKIDDPEEKKTKVLLMCLKIPALIAVLLIAFGMFVVVKASIGK